MKALIIGATGATGKDLIQTLLQDSAYTSIVAFVRKPTGVQHEKFSEVITDFDHLETASNYIQGDVLFSCLGTTIKTAGTKDKQRHVDFEIPLAFARLARRNGVAKTVLLSAYGAAIDSRIFYSQLKGELEQRITELSFDQYIIFRPGLLLRDNTDRMGERISASLLKFLNAMGLFRKFRPLPTSVLAQKLAKSPTVFGTGKHVVELEKIWEI